jgi:hypothetical protein
MNEAMNRELDEEIANNPLVIKAKREKKLKEENEQKKCGANK